MPTNNKNLTSARREKNDEFYTRYEDIEKELRHYEKQFKDKKVYCNCDDLHSNFVKYFKDNFERLGLKTLVSCGYNKEGKGEYFYFTPSYEYSLDDLDGDFRGSGSITVLNEVDIVVTNPPFSLFREYVAQLNEYNKKFLIIGGVNAITYKELFKLIKENKIRLGVSIHSGGTAYFGVHNDYPLNAAGTRVDEKGNKYIRVKGVRWYTNLEHEKRNEEITLYKKYTPEEYPNYDNYNAINVDKVKDIPSNYAGAMGVPITFMDKYNPNQFEIIHMGRYSVNGIQKYPRIIIKKI